MATPNTLRGLTLGLLAGIAAGLAGTLLVLRLRMSEPSLPLTPERFLAAKDRWKASAPADYDIEVRVTGPQGATYFVEVRDGQATKALRNGKPLTQQRTLGTWSVPGMFGTMSRDVAILEIHASGRADRSTQQLDLRATFDPEYGYPARYRRIQFVQYGPNVEAAWEVMRFERIKR